MPGTIFQSYEIMIHTYENVTWVSRGQPSYGGISKWLVLGMDIGLQGMDGLFKRNRPFDARTVDETMTC